MARGAAGGRLLRLRGAGRTMDAPEGLAEEVLAFAKKQMRHNAFQESLYDAAMAWAHAIDWRRERWLQALLVAHAVVWAVTLATRRRSSVQFVIFILTCTIVYMLERINAWCALHWREFSTQNYFDKNGVFAGVVVAMPLTLLLLFQLLNSLYLTSQLLVVQKRAELRGIVERKKDK